MTKNKAALVVELDSRVRLITNPSVFGFVRKMLDLAPAAFYEKPASTRHHLPDEQRDYGNLLHTVRVIDIVLILADACDMNQQEKDVLVAGASLHDLGRHGINGQSSSSRKDHPLLVRKLAEANGLTCDHYEKIMLVIESHMGKWGTPPFVPHADMRALLHIADCVSARVLEVLQC